MQHNKDAVMRANSAAAKTEKSQPLYRQIADTLLEGIRDGVFPVGTLLPGELDLIERHNSSRHTIREALRVLEDMGIVQRQRGRGTLVVSTEARPAFVQMVRDPRELFSYPADSSFRVMKEGAVTDSDFLPGRVGLTIDSDWAHIAGLRTLSDGSPFCWTDIYLLPDYAAIAQQLGRNSRPVYEQIADSYGETVHRIGLNICAGSLTGQRAAALEVPAGSPSLLLCRSYRGNGNRLFEISITEHPADSFSFAMEFNRGWQAGEHWSWSK